MISFKKQQHQTRHYQTNVGLVAALPDQCWSVIIYYQTNVGLVVTLPNQRWSGRDQFGLVVFFPLKSIKNN